MGSKSLLYIKDFVLAKIDANMETHFASIVTDAKRYEQTFRVGYHRCKLTYLA